MRESKVMPKIQHISHEDVRRGADKLHELLDGRIVILDALGVALVGVLGGVLPPLIIWLLWRGTV